MRDRLHSNLIRAAAFGTARILEGSARTFGWQPVSLDPDTLEAAARRAVRLEDFGDPYYRVGLGQLVQSLDHDADLHLIGRVFMRQYIRNALINRLLLQEHRRARPEVHEAPLRPPIIITGLPRTGSTWLHQVMSRVPGFFAPPYWLLVRPLPARPGDTEEARKSAAGREVRVWKSITPSLRDKHKISVTAPEECIFALSLTFQTQIFMVPAESYLAWYASSDRQGKYADYRSILMVLQAMHPDKTLLLKAPDHLGGLDALCAAVPEARIVQLHRDPVKIMSSVASLAYSAQYGLTNRRDPARVAASLADYFETTLRRNLAQRPHLPVPLLDLRYDQVVADPVGTVAQILKAFHRPLASRDRARLASYVDRKAKDQRPHRYSGTDFGLDDAQTAERFRFYSTCFEARRDEPAPVNPTLP
ncbi:MAG TPA: sulfotransferase [Aestuariivirgaceae bacterium]|nr:sulfotransferase [Aestuariivirgaceae bacterium]